MCGQSKDESHKICGHTFLLNPHPHPKTSPGCQEGIIYVSLTLLRCIVLFLIHGSYLYIRVKFLKYALCFEVKFSGVNYLAIMHSNKIVDTFAMAISW